MTDFNSEITSDDKLWAALTYVFSPLVPIIIMLMESKKNRPFIRAHNAQALVLGIISIALGTFTVGCGITCGNRAAVQASASRSPQAGRHTTK